MILFEKYDKLRTVDDQPQSTTRSSPKKKNKKVMFTNDYVMMFVKSASIAKVIALSGNFIRHS